MSTSRKPSVSRTSSRQVAQTLASTGHLVGELVGCGDVLVTDVAPFESAGETDLAYCDNPHFARRAAGGTCRCLIIPGDAAEAFAAAFAEAGREAALLPTTDPQAAFIEMMTRMRPARPKPEPRIALDAYVSPTARIGERCHVGHNAYIGEDARIGDGCTIYPNAYIAEGVRIGDDCTIGPGAVVHQDCLLGDRVQLHANAVIGTTGFGYRFENDHYVAIPHTGRVRIEDDCEIGACATVDRGMIDDTVIGHGTKLDNLVVVAHNCQLGPHNAAAGHVGLAGSVKTGPYVRFGGHAGVGDHANIGAGATVGAKAAVSGDVPAGATFHGLPAIAAGDAMRQWKAARRLPEMRKQLLALQKQVDRLTAQLDGDQTGDQTDIAKAA